MNDPINAAFSSLTQNILGVGAGTNPLAAPQIANLFGYNIPGVPIISARDYFLTQMESWYTSIPLTTQWIVVIDSYPSCINTNLIQSLEHTAGDKKAWDIDKAKSILTAFPLQKIVGCIFAQGVEIMPDNLQVEYANIQNNRGFIPAPIANGRAYPNTVSIDFLDTNTSFTDFVIRPWVIAASHYGFVARNPSDGAERNKNVKTNITVLQYTRTFQNVSMVPRKIWRFYNCCPVEVGTRSMTYDTEAFTSGRSFMPTKWVYSHYTIEPNFYFPLTSIIDRISKGKFPQVLAQLTNSPKLANLF